ncbi:MAG: CapA family protein [Nitrososphaeria archaeon]
MEQYDFCFCGDLYAEDPSKLSIGENLKTLFNRCKLRVANLETPIVIDPLAKPMNKYSALKTTPDVLKFLKQIQTSAVSLANNHIMDYGLKSAEDTVKLLTQESIKCYGYGHTLEEAFEPATVEVDGVKVGLVGVTTTFAPEALGKKDKPGVAGLTVITKINIDPREVLEEPAAPYIVGGEVLREDLDVIKNVIKKCKQGNNFVVTQIHWGAGLSPYNEVVLDYVTRLGEFLVDVGCDLVIGGHPHTIQPVNVYKGKVVTYSLGNFIFYPIMGPMENKGMILTKNLDEDGADLYFVEQNGNKVELLDAVSQNPKLAYFRYQSEKNGVRLVDNGDHLSVKVG